MMAQSMNGLGVAENGGTRVRVSDGRTFPLRREPSGDVCAWVVEEYELAARAATIEQAASQALSRNGTADEHWLARLAHQLELEFS